MLNWIVVDEDYLSYLRGFEPRIPFSDYGEDKFKPFFGVLFKDGDLVYITQISHPQKRHEKMKNSPDFYKLYHPDEGNLIAVVNLNYMFPVHIDFITKLEYKNIELHRNFKTNSEKTKYIDLLKKELNEIRELKLEDKAISIYQSKYKYPEDRVSKRCLDFKLLEEYANNFQSYLKTNSEKNNSEDKKD